MTSSTGKKTLCLLLMVYFVLLSLLPNNQPNILGISNSLNKAQIPIDYSQVIPSVNMTAVRENIAYFSSFPTRATGYPGSFESAQYIYDRFTEYGLENVSFYDFNLTDCFDEGSTVTILSTGESVTIHALWPNLVSPSTTPPEGLTGPLIYAGNGRLEDFDGKEVEGSIVLLDWKSTDGWLTAAKLGAKAVIFLAPKVLLPSVFGNTNEKSLPEIPMKFPRFYVEEEGENLLLSHISEEARVVCSQQWKLIEGRNVVGWIKGTVNPDLYVLLSAHYDSYSIAPGVAPGAQDAIGISTLLELAKYFAVNRPKYSVIVAAFGAYHHNLWGAVTFAYDFVQPGKGPTLGTPTPPQSLRDAVRNGLKLNINLDLTTVTDVLYLYPFSQGYYQSHSAAVPFTEYADFATYLNGIIEELSSQGIKVVEEIKGPFGGTFYSTYIEKDFSWKQFPFDSEAFYMVGIASYSFTTAYDCRPYFLEPFDTIENLNFQNLQPQLEAAFYIITRVLHEDRFPELLGHFHPTNSNTKSSDWFVSMIGQVVEYNKTQVWYTPIPHALVSLTIMHSYYGGSTLQRRFVFADEEGKFRFYGCRVDRDHHITSWVVNASGDITYAPDFGKHSFGSPLLGAYYNGVFKGGGGSGVTNLHGEHIKDLSFVTSFKAASIILMDCFIPETLSYLQAGNIVFENSIRIIGLPEKTSLDSHSKSPIGGGMEGPTSLDRYFITFIAVPPNTRFGLTYAAKTPISRYPSGILMNYTQDSYEPYGYVMEWGEQTIIPFLPLKIAEDFYLITKHFADILSKVAPSEAKSTDILLLKQINQYIDWANESLASNEYSEYYAISTQAWLIAKNAYHSIRSKTENFVLAVTILSLMLLPFVYVTQRLLFGDISGYKSLILFISIFTVTLCVFYTSHPGFALAASPVMTVTGFSTLILTFPILGVIFSKFIKFLNILRIQYKGMHEVSVGRISMIIQAILIGIENMRKTRLRTILTLGSLAIMVMSQVSLSSLSISLITVAGETGRIPLNEGISLHKPLWGEGVFSLNKDIPGIIEATYNENVTVIPRAWKYTLDRYRGKSNPGLMIGYKSTYEDKMLSTPVLWGLTPEEVDLSHPELFLVGNRSRWFIETDRRACILTEKQASQLGITGEELPVTISVEGVPFTVIGLISPNYALMVDLDNEEIAPIKFDVVEPENPWNIHVGGDYCLIMSYQDVLDLAGSLASVSIVFKDTTNLTKESVDRIAKEMHQRFPFFIIHYGVDEMIFQITEASEISLIRWETQIVMTTLVAISVLNMMIGNVYQRKKHIYIYSTLGLSPLNICFVFLAETLTYALMGGVFGYLFGLFFGRISANLFQGTIILNYASSWVLISVGTAILTTLLSSIYPMYLASKLVTPSMERKWKMPTKPIGDMWEIPFPVVVTSEEEATGILAYLKEFCEGHRIDAPVFIAQDVKLGRDEQGLPMLFLKCRLFPYELGIRQDVSFHTITSEDKWRFFLRLKKTLGPIDDWEKQNRSFVDVVRKQMMLWNVLSEEVRKKYLTRI